MNLQKNYWDNLYESKLNEPPNYDLWLDKYESILIKSKDTPIIDLGCGFGNNTLYLKERSYEVVSCDFSEKVLKKLSTFIDNLTTKCFDLKDGLPFQDNYTKMIISDLSLHYFTWDDTKKILKEIERVLKTDGVLLCRVNSTNDINYGAGKGIKLEENFYDINGNLKRFFNEEQLKDLFKDWEIQYINETQLNRYHLSKIAWELLLKKKN